MRPPLGQRYIPVYEWESRRPDARTIRCKDRSGDVSTADQPELFCAWCERQWPKTTKLYPYSPVDHRVDHDDIRCCCWACFHQWLIYHEKVSDELDLWFVLGVTPEFIPGWYLSEEVRVMLAHAARDRQAVKLARESVRETGLRQPKSYKNRTAV